MVSPSVLVVEDEADLRSTVCGFLELSGIAVRGVGNAVELDRAWNEKPADILILDVNLPGEDGFSIAARMRRASPVGIIMMSARGETDDRIFGRKAGADVYLVKPLELRELLATIETLLTRLRIAHPVPVCEGVSWLLDCVRWTLTPPGSVAVELTASEFKFLDILLSAPGRPIVTTAILDRLGKAANEDGRRSLDALLSRLRRKVETETGMALPIKSVRSVGYTFADAVTRSDGSLIVNDAP